MKNSVKLLFCLIVLVSVFTITGVKAETFDGEYSTEYLLRNYNVVTFNNNSSDRHIVFDDVVSDDNYIDSDKLYMTVMNESQLLVEKAKKKINSAKLEVSSPGIYTVDNTASLKRTDGENPFDDNGFLTAGDYYYNSLLIKNYDRNDVYVFNYLNEYIRNGSLPTIYIMESGSGNVVNIKDYYDSGKYTGNIIFNFPNARKIELYNDYRFYTAVHRELKIKDFDNSGLNASIIAPKAYIGIDHYNYDYYYFGTIIADKIVNEYEYRDFIIERANYNVQKKLIDDEIASYTINSIDYDDDFYIRDYSIRDLLQNYSLVTLGQNELDARTKLSRNNQYPGSVRLFHITGQALINGDMYFDNSDFKTSFDLESNRVTESYINGKFYYDDNNPFVSNVVIQPWDNMSNDRISYIYQKNSLFVAGSSSYEWLLHTKSGVGNYTGFMYDYINFNRLYNNIVAEQKGIEEGDKVKRGEDNKIHLKVGGTYTIEDINDVNEIILDNFEDNKDKLTIITVKNSGDVNFPLISKDSGDYKGIVTNDYYGKSEATHFYEEDTFVQDTYHGNIVWNLPNATYVKLKEGAPFAGHLIAPKADVETEETHFAGCFIVNSIYGEGNTEAHFYPLTAKACDCDDYKALPTRLKEAADNYYISKKLGGDYSIIDTWFMGDRNQYNDDVSKFENILTQCKITENNSSNGNSIVDILTNPLTENNLILFIVLASIVGGSIFIMLRRKVNNN